MKVLQVGKFYLPYRGGMETHLASLCTSLDGLIDMEVLVSGNSFRSKRESMAGVRVIRAGRWFTIASAPVCPGMASAIRQADADVVHIHWPNPAAVMAYFASGHSGPLVMTYHSDIIRQKFLKRYVQPWLDRALERSAAVIVGSEAYIESSPTLRRFRNKCCVIPFGIDLSPFETVDSVKVQRLRQLYGSRIILSVGRMVYYKGFEYLVEAMRFVDGRLLLVGNGPLRPELEQLALNNGVADRISFLGAVDDLVPYHYASDIFVLPSVARSEAFGLVQLEAMACGKPVINTRLDSGVPFVSRDGVTGVTVPVANASALGQAIQLLLDNTELRARYGRAGKSRAYQEFSLTRMSERTLDVYRRTMADVSGGGLRTAEVTMPSAVR